MNLFSIVGVLVLVIFLTLIGILSRYRKCKSDEILVIYGKTGGNKSSKCIQGGAAFVIPILQGYAYMSLKPLQFDCNLQKALSSQNIRVDVPTTVTVGISTEQDVMQAAAERILGLGRTEIEDLVRDIVYGQMRTIIADMTIEKLNADRDEFLVKAKGLIDSELRKIGLYLININITDIRDEAGYIVQLGKKDQAKAINQANIEIANAEREGETKVAEQLKIKNSMIAETKKEELIAIANAQRDQSISVAQAESERDSKVAEAMKDRDISVASFDSQARIGEIEASKKVTVSNAELEVIKAEAQGKALSADERAKAEIEKNKELARKEAEEARAKRTEAALKAEQIVPAEIAKQQKLIDAQAYQLKLEKEAEANANQQRIEAQGRADAYAAEGRGKGDAVKAEGLAQAEVIREQGLAKAAAEKASLLAQAEGFEAMVKVAENNPQVAIQWKMVDQWKEIAAEQVKAFEHIKLGNVNVMDTTQGGTLTNLLTGLVSSVAPVTDIMKNIPGIPNVLKGKDGKSSEAGES
ncbi:MAG: flotillin family protein [Dysgonamonadaceae bacterium]|jgi:flotillin|nr:flotillin family protein [Dysgonamonadaceae bacterium]